MIPVPDHGEILREQAGPDLRRISVGMYWGIGRVLVVDQLVKIRVEDPDALQIVLKA